MRIPHTNTIQSRTAFFNAVKFCITAFRQLLINGSNDKLLSK